MQIMASSLTGKENAFCEAYILHKGDKVKAYTDAGYSVKMSKAAIAVQADKVFNKPKIALKIKELQKLATSAFIWSKEKKLEILQKVAEKCSRDDEEKGMANAAAVVSAIKEHNIMQGDNAPIETTATDTLPDAINKLIDKLPN